jgi:hypothetical protein
MDETQPKWIRELKKLADEINSLPLPLRKRVMRKFMGKQANKQKLLQ